MAPRNFIVSIVLGAEYLSYVEFIATYALTFFGYIISVLASVKEHFWKTARNSMVGKKLSNYVMLVMHAQT